MPLNNTAKNLMLEALAGEAVWISLHDDDPAGTGANEISGGSPAYARKQITWAAAATGELDDSTNGLAFDVPADTTISHVAYWSAATDGTCYGDDEVDEEVFNGQGVYTLTDAKIALPDPA